MTVICLELGQLYDIGWFACPTTESKQLTKVEQAGFACRSSAKKCRFQSHLLGELDNRRNWLPYCFSRLIGVYWLNRKPLEFNRAHIRSWARSPRSPLAK